MTNLDALFSTEYLNSTLSNKSKDNTLNSPKLANVPKVRPTTLVKLNDKIRVDNRLSNGKEFQKLIAESKPVKIEKIYKNLNFYFKKTFNVIYKDMQITHILIEQVN